MKNVNWSFIWLYRLKENHTAYVDRLTMEPKHQFLLAHDRSHMILLSILLAGYCFVHVHQQIPLMSHGKNNF